MTSHGFLTATAAQKAKLAAMMEPSWVAEMYSQVTVTMRLGSGTKNHVLYLVIGTQEGITELRWRKLAEGNGNDT